MVKRKVNWTSLILCLCFLILILDAKTAIGGATEGIKLCLYTVVPSLFPFFLISILVNTELLGHKIPIIRPLGRLCGIPEGAESLLVLGFIGGYPVGAQCINEACRTKAISLPTGRRMLAFCNNAGPAFIFGMGSCLFSSPAVVWVVWIIQILSAIAVGALIPGKDKDMTQIKQNIVITLPQALEKSLRIMASVCGWVVIFRVVLCFFSRWFLWLFPTTAQVLITGLMELSNGSVGLLNLSTGGMRFLLFNVMLSFGGICVAMQTVSTVKDVGPGMYFPGKLLQAAAAFLLSVLMQPILFTPQERWEVSPVLTIATATIFSFFLLMLRKSKKRVAFTRQMLYNTQKC